MLHQGRSICDRRSQERRGMYNIHPLYGPDRRAGGDRRSGQSRRLAQQSSSSPALSEIHPFDIRRAVRECLTGLGFSGPNART